MSRTKQGRVPRSLLPPIPHSSPALQQVHEFVASQGDQIAQLTIDEVAHGAGVSKATVIRFCKEQGFSGYKELKHSVVGDILARADAAQSGDENGSGTADFLDSLFSEHMESLRETFQMIRRDLFNTVSDRLANSALIVWYGIGESGALAQAADYKCLLGNMNSKVAIEHSTLRHMAHQLTAQDTVVCISRSGRRGTAFRTLQELRKVCQAQIVSITGTAGSAIATISHSALITAPRDIFCNDMKISWLTPQLFMIDALIADALRKRYPDNVTFPW